MLIRLFPAWIGTIAVLFRCSGLTASHPNSFDAIAGCLQFDHVPGYDETLKYFPTNGFKNVGKTHNSRFYRIGILGTNDGHIRFGRSPYPFDEAVIELVISGWGNTQSVARRQTRHRDQSYDNVLLKEASTPQLLSRYWPLVFRMEVFDNGHVQLTKDGEMRPFLEYTDPTNVIPTDYIAFTQCCGGDLVYFYDCPLKEDASDSNNANNTALFRCSLEP